MTIIAFGSDFHEDLQEQPIIDSFKTHLLQTKADIFCFGGDMSTDLRQTMKLLNEIEQDTGVKVLAVTGNHEMWDPSFSSSFEAAAYFNQHAPHLSVMQTPYQFSDWVVLGNMGWYDYSTAQPYFRLRQIQKKRYRSAEWSDGQYCKWDGKSDPEVADFFLAALETQLKQHEGKHIILMSHMLPFQDYILRSGDKAANFFHSYLGNLRIGQLAEAYNVRITQFGHTHFRFHTQRPSGMKIVCAPLGYEDEWTSKEKQIADEWGHALVVLDV